MNLPFEGKEWSVTFGLRHIFYIVFLILVVTYINNNSTESTFTNINCPEGSDISQLPTGEDEYSKAKTLNDKSAIECSPVIASVGNRNITLAEFRAYMVRRSGGYAGRFDSLETKQSLLDEMIENEAQIAHAYQAGIDRDPEIIAMLERIMVGKLREQSIDKTIHSLSVSESEVEEYFNNHIEDYITPAMYRGAIIQFSIPAQASDDKKAAVLEKAKKVLKLATTIPESVRGFGALAVQHSEDQATRYIGGDIGWVVDGKDSRSIPAEVSHALLTLKQQGELAPVVITDEACYLVKLIEYRPAETASLASVRQKIQQQLQYNKRKLAEASWLTSLKSSNVNVYISDDRLKEVVSAEGYLVRNQELEPPTLPYK